MTIAVSCECGQRYQVKDDLAGKKFKCKKCGLVLIATAPENKAADDDDFPLAGLELHEDQPSLPPRLTAKGKKKKAEASPPSHETGRGLVGGPTLEERMAARAEEAETAEVRSLKRPLSLIGGGLFLIALGVGIYWFLANLEVEGGIRRVHWIVAVLYRFGGKWGAALFFVGLGAINLILAILHFCGIVIYTGDDDD